MGPYSKSLWYYIVIQSTEITEGKLLAHAAAEVKEKMAMKSFLSISKQESGRPEKHCDAGNITLV